MKNAGKAFISNTLLVEILIILAVILFGAVGFHYVEGLSLFHSLYFVMTTMSTIGLGDITPKTDLGRVLVIFYSFLGVPLFLSISGLMLESRFNRRIKSYVSKFHKELREAETELKDMEEKVSETLEDVLETTENTQDRVEETQDQVDENTDRIVEVEEKIEKKSKKKSK